MRVYEGIRNQLGTEVTVLGPGGRPVQLDLRLDLRKHSPTGFEWGYMGSGPSQLALALCAHVLQDDARAQRVYQQFKAKVISPICGPRWALDEVVILRAIEEIEKEAA